MSGYALKLSDIEVARYRRMAERARRDEADLWGCAGISPGARVCDVGCGPGAMTAVLAETVGPTGRVVGIDGDEGAVAAARDHLASSGIDNAEIGVGRAQATGLAPGLFDTVMLRHVLAHNGGAEQDIVDHLASLVRPGGTVFLVDTDLSASRLSREPDGWRDLIDTYVGFHRQRGNDPSAGLRLAHRATAAGLDVLAYRGWYSVTEAAPGMRGPAWAAREAMVSAGVADSDDVARWAATFEELDVTAQRPFHFAALFALVGRRPSA